MILLTSPSLLVPLNVSFPLQRKEQNCVQKSVCIDDDICLTDQSLHECIMFIVEFDALVFDVLSGRG